EHSMPIHCRHMLCLWLSSSSQPSIHCFLLSQITAATRKSSCTSSAPWGHWLVHRCFFSADRKLSASGYSEVCLQQLVMQAVLFSTMPSFRKLQNPRIRIKSARKD